MRVLRLSPKNEVRKCTIRQIQNFLENESLTTDFAETQQIDNILWKNGGFDISDSIGIFEGGGGRELMAKTVLKKGFYHNFNDSLIGFWLNSAQNDVYGMARWIRINF